MAKAKKTDTPAFSFPVVEEDETPEIIVNDGKSSEDLGKEIDAARIEKETPVEDTAAADLKFKAPEDVEPPTPIEDAPVEDTAGEKTATERLMEKKGYESQEEISKAYEDLEKLLGKRDGHVPEEEPPKPLPTPAPPAQEPTSFDPFWERMAQDPITTLRELVRNTNMEDAQAFQGQFRESTQKRLAFEGVAEKRLPYWKDISPDYNRNLQLGMNFDEAFERAELKHLRGHYKKGYTRGLEDKDTKETQAANAEIEGSFSSPSKEAKEITPEEFDRLSLADMEKLLPHKY